MMRPMWQTSNHRHLQTIKQVAAKWEHDSTERPFSLFLDPLGAGERLWIIRWWRFFLRLAAVVCLVSAAAFAANASMKTLTRTTDPVTVPGHKLRLLQGKKINRLGLFVFDGQALRPIPFQIDERRDGQYVYAHGEIASTDVDEGALDADDELAFICADAGPRLQPFLLPPGVEAGLELDVVDPRDGGRAYVYLLAFAGPAPRSNVDYVWYHEQANEIETTDYLIGYHADAPISAAKLYVKPAIGGTNVSVADRQKVRIEGDLFWNLMHLERNENDFRAEVLGYIDGPVRIIRRTKNWNRLVWKIPTPSVELTSVYWKTGMEFPLTIDLPFKISTFFRSAAMRIYIDTPPQVTGRRYYNDHNPQGVDIDGMMSEAELKLDPAPFDWQVVAGSRPEHPEGWFSRNMYDKDKIPASMVLYYHDDVGRLDPPERYPGCYGCLGFEFVDLDKLPAGKFSILIQMYPVVNYHPGDERRLLQIADAPLQVNSRVIPNN